MNNGNKNNSSTLLILGGFILVLGLLAIGYRITTVSFGPVSLGFNEPPASNSNSNNDNVVNNSSSQETTTTTDNFSTVSTIVPEIIPPADTNPILNVPFQDNFDQGLNPAWRVISGRPLIVNGQLTSTSDTLSLEIGNTSLNNYVLEMDVRGEDANYCGFGYWNYLKLNFAPALQYQFGYTDSNGRAKWLINDSGNWTEILRQDDLDCGRFRFVVTGNSYKVYINGQLAGELISDYAEGPLLVQIDDSVFIDNFEIK